MSTVATPDDVLDGIGFPTKRDEAWRYAPHRQLSELTFGPGEAGQTPVEVDEMIPALDGPRIVVVDGVVSWEHSHLDGPDGLDLQALGDVDPALVRAHRDSVQVVDAYVALNVAHATAGAVIRIAEGAHIETPIHVVDIARPGSSANTSSTAVIVELGAGSSATIVETRTGVGSDGKSVGGSNVLTSIALGADATLEHVLVQDLPTDRVHLSRVVVSQAERSTLRTRSFNLGAAYGRLAYHVELSGPGAVADLSGLFFGIGEQILDQQITVVHNAQDCTSRQTFRGVLDDASTGVFNGGIDVCPGADGTDAEQSNDNLLLSNRAEVNTQPRLEILADEVACKHGATVGQLDDTALYYLRSRGINADEARRLLINGFADQIVDDVSVEAVRNWITHRLGHDHD
jgi:Fe-S cluster assembly protein SufD